MSSDYNNRLILLVDDLESMHDNYREILTPDIPESISDLEKFDEEFFGDSMVTSSPVIPEYQLVSALQGKDAYERVKEAYENGEPYAMAFVDVRMPPGWDGIETIEKIWEVDPDIQVVICTAYSDYSWKKIYEKFGRTDKLVMLRKPFDQVEVMQLALSLTEKWNLMRQVRKQKDELEIQVKERTADLEKALIELEERKDLEKETEKLRTAYELAATVAHEFNNPLAIMKGIVELAELEKVPMEKKIQQFNKLPAQIQRMSDLVKRMLTLSEIKEVDYAAGMKIIDLHSNKDED